MNRVIFGQVMKWGVGAMVGVMGVMGVVRGEVSPVSCPEGAATAVAVEKMKEEVEKKFSGAFSAGYQTKYVCRGWCETKDAATVGLSLGYKVGDGLLHMDYFSGIPFRGPGHEDYAENDITVGYGWDAAAWLAVDVGVTYDTYPNVFDNANAYNRDWQGQVKFVFKELPLNPTLLMAYNVTTKMRNVELGLMHEIKLKGKFSVQLSGCFGTFYARRFNGDQRHTDGVTRNGYEYLVIGGDIVYKVSDAITFMAGPRYTANNDSIGGNSINTLNGKSHNSWVMCGVNVSF